MITVAELLKMRLISDFVIVDAEQYGGDGHGDVTITLNDGSGNNFVIAGNPQTVTDLAEFFTKLDNKISTLTDRYLKNGSN